MATFQEYAGFAGKNAKKLIIRYCKQNPHLLCTCCLVGNLAEIIYKRWQKLMKGMAANTTEESANLS